MSSSSGRLPTLLVLPAVSCGPAVELGRSSLRLPQCDGCYSRAMANERTNAYVKITAQHAKKGPTCMATTESMPPIWFNPLSTLVLRFPNGPAVLDLCIPASLVDVSDIRRMAVLLSARALVCVGVECPNNTIAETSVPSQRKVVRPTRGRGRTGIFIWQFRGKS